MKAFHGKPEIKEFYLKRIAHHREMDHLVQGVGWETNGKTRGCAIGCTFEEYNHKKMVEEWDVPRVLAHLEDAIFEGLPVEKALDWPYRFTDALEPGVDYQLVWPKFYLWLLHRIRKSFKKDDIRSSINKAISVYQRWVDGEDISSEEFRELAMAATVAARYTAWAAQAARAGGAAEAARCAAWAARAARVGGAAIAAQYAVMAAKYAKEASEAIEWEIMADKLIEIIQKEKRKIS